MPPPNIPKKILQVPFRISKRVLRGSERALLQFVRIIAHLPAFPFLTPGEQEVLVNVLAHSKDGAAPELKLKIYQVLKRLKKRRKKPFGMLIVLGWQKEWAEKYSSLPDASQNLFQSLPFPFASVPEEKALEALAKIADFDGAIFMSSRGDLIASGMYLEAMAPKKVAEALNPAKAEDLSEALGFVKKVHARHLAGIAASYWLKGTTVFVVSEEDGSIRLFEGGRIIFSTIRKEIHRA